MVNLQPSQPEDLDPLAAQILEGLKNQPSAQAIVLGGYFALKHYLNYRQSKDVDAWWSQSSGTDEKQAAIQLLRQVIADVCRRNGLELSERSSSTTLSLELKRGRETVFSVQIAARDVELEPPILSPYPPIQIETLRDNVGAKMNALVNRGAPRDFLDIYAIVQSDLVTVQEVWNCWQQKNLQQDLASAKLQILHYLNAIEQRRPLEQLPENERAQAANLRTWMRQHLLDLPEQQQDRGVER